MNPDIKRAIILDNYKNPKNKYKSDKYQSLRANTSHCIDDIMLYIDYKDNLIQDITFDGEACAISTAATSLMIKKLIGKTKEEALKLIDNYEAMIFEKDFDKELLEDLIVFQDIGKQPNRITCATLSFNSIREFLNDQGDK